MNNELPTLEQLFNQAEEIMNKPIYQSEPSTINENAIKYFQKKSALVNMLTINEIREILEDTTEMQGPMGKIRKAIKEDYDQVAECFM